MFKNVAVFVKHIRSFFCPLFFSCKDIFGRLLTISKFTGFADR